MSLTIRRAAVLGAGVMGAQIAAHLAAAGIETFLLDLPSPAAEGGGAREPLKRSARAVQAIENLKQLKPSPLYSADDLDLLKPGNFDDDLGELATCDWVLEAVVERLDVKQKLHSRVSEIVRPGVPVTSNTSGISLAAIADSLPGAYQAAFFGTHFFNPPRYMKLLELIPYAKTDLGLFEAFATWAEEKLGKGIVRACDTPNFVANRIGTLVSQSAYKIMEDLDINVETVDALTGPLIGRSKSATFRTSDIVGLDTGAAVALNTYNQAPDDPYRDHFLPPAWIAELIEKGSLGQKTKSVGIFKRVKNDSGQSEILAYRPASKTYEALAVETFPWQADALREKDTIKRIKLILEHRDKGALFVWRNMRDIFSYAAYLLCDIAEGYVQPVDDAVRWGFNWEFGPFELWQALGYDAILARMQEDKAPLPSWARPGLSFYSPEPGSREMIAAGGPQTQLRASGNSARVVPIAQRPHQYHLPAFENKEEPRLVLSHPDASLIDIGDGVACFVVHSKMNTMNVAIAGEMRRTLEKVGSDFKALVIGNDAANFSAGADLRDLAKHIQAKDWAAIEGMEAEYQSVMQELKYAPFPIVSCPSGMTLGGGCELSLHTQARVLAAETTAGLVEFHVGLLPAGGGMKELALRAYAAAAAGSAGGLKADPFPFLLSAFELIRTGRTSLSAHEALEMGLYPRLGSEIVLSKEHVIHRAKHWALYLAGNFKAPTRRIAVEALGRKGIERFRSHLVDLVGLKQISSYDAEIGGYLAQVLSGGAVEEGRLVSEADFLAEERRVFLELCRQPRTFERMEAMLKTGKRLFN